MTDAKRLGAAFSAGMAFARGRRIAQDAAQWITVKPNGAEHKGQPVLIEKTTGEVLGGMGGRFNGQKIGNVANVGRKRRDERKTRRQALRQRKSVSQSMDFTLPSKIDKSKILQNRERSNQGSIMQMHSIAKDPDYSRLGFSHDFGSGAPVVAYGTIPKNSLAARQRQQCRTEQSTKFSTP